MAPRVPKRKASQLPQDEAAAFGAQLVAPGRTSRVVLSIPEAEDECMITMEPVASAALEWLPDAAFSKERPLHRKMTLECGHSFAALPVLYHMTRNGMNCPACRQGTTEPMGADSVPGHLRKAFMGRVHAETARDRLEVYQTDLQESVRLWREDVASGLDFAAEYLVRSSVTVSALIYGFQGDANRPDLVMSYPLEMAQPSETGFTFALSRQHTRTLSRNLELVPHLDQFTVVLSARGPNAEPLRLDETPRFELEAQGPQLVILVAEHSTLEIRTLLDSSRGLERLSWSILRNDLGAMLQGVVSPLL